MAEKKKLQGRAYQRKKSTEYQESKDTAFHGKDSEYRARDETGIGKSNEHQNTEGPKQSNQKQSRKNLERQHRERIPNNTELQPTDFKPEQHKTFQTNTEDDSFFRDNSSVEDGDYRKRDTYHRTEQKSSYHKRMIQKEQKRKRSAENMENVVHDSQSHKSVNSDFRSQDTTFTEGTGSEFSYSKKVEKKRVQAEKVGRKTQKAREKLPRTREYTFRRVFDEQSGKSKYVLTAVERPKYQRKRDMAKGAAQRVQQAELNEIHSKISQVEKENSAVEGAHKTELFLEDTYRFVKRTHKSRDKKAELKVAKLENKQFKKEVNFRYQKFLEENPQMQEKTLHNQLQKKLQKQRIKKQYMKAKRNAATAKVAEEAAHSTKSAAVMIARKIQEMVRTHATVLVTVGIFVILLIMIMTLVSSCGSMFAGTQSTVLASSYLSQPADIDAVDLEFTRLEMELQNTIDNIESDHPGYDEYHYNVGDIGHNPFTLISYLSTLHTQFTASEMMSEVESLFGDMYTLTLTPTTETRTGTDSDGDEYEYEVEILNISLSVTPLETLASGRLDAEQMEIYSTYNSTGGLLQNFASPVELYWYNYIGSYYGYRKNPVTGAQQFHRGLDISIPTGTNVFAGHDGTVTEAGYDSEYGNYVVITKDRYVTKYAHLNSLNVSAGQTIKKGDSIGASGNTGSSTGSHLHIECLYNGEYYNPLFYFDVGSGTLYGETPGGGAGGAAPGGNATPPDSYDDATVQTLMNEAERYLGMPYTFGGTPPASFDCSGFVCWVFSNSGVHDLPRTTAQGIYDQSTPISASEAKAGDIIFFTGTYDAGRPVTHVGIYCGNGVMIHCGDPIKYSSINTAYWQSHFYGFGRL